PGAVATGADFAENLEAALQLVLVIGAENAGKRPVLLFDMRGRMVLRHGGSGDTDYQRQGGKDGLGVQHGSCPLPQCALPRTLSEMLVGNGRGVSMRPSSGRMTRKWMK